ncbi:hypothetical protein DL96DRAFT_1707038 [Flagelloscypha sp. PMI_526]|nr:hypothetical protein DL96DRAFT_1707038 [Flagelloscypha sp. PMI_526]
MHNTSRLSARYDNRAKSRSPSPRLTMATKVAVREETVPHRFHIVPLRDRSGNRLRNRGSQIAPSEHTAFTSLRKAVLKPSVETELVKSRLVSSACYQFLKAPRRSTGSMTRSSINLVENLPPPRQTTNRSPLRPPKLVNHLRSNSESTFSSSTTLLRPDIASPARSHNKHSRASELFVSPLRRPKSAMSASLLNSGASQTSLKSSSTGSNSSVGTRLKKKVSFSDDSVDENAPGFDSLYPTSLSIPIVRSLLEDEITVTSMRNRSGSNSTAFSDSTVSESASCILPYHTRSTPKRPTHKTSHSFSGEITPIKSSIPAPSATRTHRRRRSSSTHRSVDFGLDDRVRPPLPPLPMIPMSTKFDYARSDSSPSTTATSSPEQHSTDDEDMKTPTLESYHRAASYMPTPISKNKIVISDSDETTDEEGTPKLSQSNSFTAPLKFHARSCSSSDAFDPYPEKRQGVYISSMDLIANLEQTPHTPTARCISFGTISQSSGSQRSLDSLGSVARLRGNSRAVSLGAVRRTKEIEGSPAMRELIGMVEQAIREWEGLRLQNKGWI